MENLCKPDRDGVILNPHLFTLKAAFNFTLPHKSPAMQRVSETAVPYSFNKALEFTFII